MTKLPFQNVQIFAGLHRSRNGVETPTGVGRLCNWTPNPDGPSGGYYTKKSDESAQVFHPNFLGVEEYQLKIFSKMGILIFESNDVNIGWDGYFNGQLSNSGVYIWKVRGKYRNGQPFTMMGDVTLLKY